MEHVPIDFSGSDRQGLQICEIRLVIHCSFSNFIISLQQSLQSMNMTITEVPVRPGCSTQPSSPCSFLGLLHHTLGQYLTLCTLQMECSNVPMI